MSVASDSTLSAAAQQKIKDITQQMMSGSLSLADANSQANAIRASEGANYTATTKGATVYKTGSSSTTGSSASGSSGSLDYSLMIQNAINNNASGDTVQALLDARNAKTSANADYYASKGISDSDSISKVAQAYIDSQNNPSQTQYGSFEDFLNGSGYDQYSAQTKAAIQAMVDSAVSGYQDQIDTTNTDSAELARHAYIAKMLGQKNLNQQLSASGYSGGMADSQKIQTETNYQNNLTSIENQRLATIKELQTAITQAQLSGNQQAAEQLASELQNAQSQWSSYVQNQNSLNASVASDNKSAAYTKAWNLLQMGQMPDSSTLELAGISQTEAMAARTYYANLIAQQNGSTTGATTATTKTTTKTSSGSTSSTASKTAAASTSATTTGMNTSNFEAFAKSVAAQLAAGSTDAAVSNINKNWSGLSEAQKTQLQTLLGKYGYSYAT